jgi:hypothetical protein
MFVSRQNIFFTIFNAARLEVLAAGDLMDDVTTVFNSYKQFALNMLNEIQNGVCHVSKTSICDYHNTGVPLETDPIHLSNPMISAGRNPHFASMRRVMGSSESLRRPDTLATSKETTGMQT